MQVPVEAVNVDSQGEFCYIIENGVLVKKYVTTGISSEAYIQILDGITANQEIVTTAVYGMGLDEGMAVTGMPMSAMNGAELGGTDTQNETADSTQTVDEDTATSQEQTEDVTDNG